MNAVTTAHCRYYLLEDRIHTFDLLDNSRQTLDEFFELRSQLQDEKSEEATHESMLLLIRLEMSHMPSLTHIVTHVRNFAQKYPRIQPTSTAIIYRRGMLVFVLNNFLKVFVRSQDEIKFFAEDEADKGIEWLRHKT